MILTVKDPTGKFQKANVPGGKPLGEALAPYRDAIRHVQINGRFCKDWEGFAGSSSNEDRVTLFVKTDLDPATWAAIIGAIISAAINVTLQLLAPKPKKPNFNNRTDESSSLAGLHNATETGSPLFYSFGENRLYGTVISTGIKVAPDGKSMRGRVLYYMGITDGFGIEGIDEIIIDDQPIENHPDIQVDIRLGTADQAIIPGFENVPQVFTDQRTFSNAAPIIYTSRSDNVNQLNPVISFSTLSSVDAKGRIGTASCAVKIERKLTADPVSAFAEVAGSPFTLSGRTNSPIFFPLEITVAGVGAGDQYDLRFTKATPGEGTNVPPDPQLFNLEEVQWTSRNYANNALMAISNIPSADFPSLERLKTSARLRGNLIPVPDGAGGFHRAWTRDRVWIARYMATHPDFGCGSGARRQLPARVMTKVDYPGLIDNPFRLLR